LKGGIVGNETMVDSFFDEFADVDIIEMNDGSLLVSDDRAGVIYRITCSKGIPEF
jgi:glucose/arabinose dehydrogenase